MWLAEPLNTNTPIQSPTPPAPATTAAAQGDQDEKEEGPWEAGIELDAQDTRGLRPIHLAARKDLAVRVLLGLRGFSGCGWGD